MLDSQRLTVVVIVVLLVSVPVLWQLGHVRTMQAAEQRQSDLVGGVTTDRQLPDDYDGDGLPDASDECPTRSETDNGFQESDGCPDVVETTGAS